MEISIAQWSFENIRSTDSERADRLEMAASSDHLVLALAEAAAHAAERGGLRLAMDSRKNEFTECRSIIQFPIHRDVFDWFYNARSGYRAQYWIGADEGTEFNTAIIRAILSSIGSHLGDLLTVRKIELLPGQGRQECDLGELKLTKERFLRSLDPAISKIWMCERRYSNYGKQPEHIGDFELAVAERGPKLHVPRWDRPNPDFGTPGEGLRAPYPTEENSWLDLKGGFLAADGTLGQEKRSKVRGQQLHEFGWTWQPPRRSNVGILAYGSLIENPGDEIRAVIVDTISNVTTPFNVEFARTSTSRCGAPTLVPVEGFGAPVQAYILLLNASEQEATDFLYRREIDKVGSDRRYRHRQRPDLNTVIVKRLVDFHGVGAVLYTEIGANIDKLTAANLAELAIASAQELDNGRDGISYLIDATKHGIRTALSDEYAAEINKKLETNDLPEALAKIRANKPL